MGRAVQLASRLYCLVQSSGKWSRVRCVAVSWLRQRDDAHVAGFLYSRVWRFPLLGMRSIEQQMRGQYFAIDLTDMSEWLARKQINPSRFTYSTDQFSASPDRENQVRI